MSRDKYREECLAEAARLRKKAGIYQELVDRTPGSSNKWNRQHVVDLTRWAEAAEREAGR